MSIREPRIYSIQCPKCGSGASTVRDSRLRTSNNSIRRRRECMSCKYRYTTREAIINEHPERPPTDDELIEGLLCIA